MYRTFYDGHTLLGFPLFALLVFVALFTGAVLYAALRDRRGGRLDALARMPLADDEVAHVSPVAPALRADGGKADA